MIVYAIKLAWWVIATFVVGIETVPAVVLESEPVTITEDSPSWDCATMGNGICGPENGLPATIDGAPIVTVTDVVACADRLGGATDANLAHCATLAGFPCGDPYTDPLRSECR